MTTPYKPMGLAPTITRDIFRRIVALRDELDLTVLLVEQNARAALRVADHVYVLERGGVVLHGTCGEVGESEQIRRAYLGG